jgi:hypothetical protein
MATPCVECPRRWLAQFAADLLARGRPLGRPLFVHNFMLSHANCLPIRATRLVANGGRRAINVRAVSQLIIVPMSILEGGVREIEGGPLSKSPYRQSGSLRSEGSEQHYRILEPRWNLDCLAAAASDAVPIENSQKHQTLDDGTATPARTGDL